MEAKPNSDFSEACADVVAGKLPLFGDLSPMEIEAGKTACAIPMVALDLPGCLAIAVLRDDRIRVVASYQAALEPMFFGPADAVTISDPQVRLVELMKRAERSIKGDPEAAVVYLTDDAFARSMVEQFHRGGTHAH